MEQKMYPESLKEARQILEVAAVKMAVERRTTEDLIDINTAQGAFRDQVIDQGYAVEEDLLFHLKVVSAGKNDVLKSLFMKIFPDLFDLLTKTQGIDNKKWFDAIHEHDLIIEHVSDQDKEAAAEAMKLHLQ